MRPVHRSVVGAVALLLTILSATGRSDAEVRRWVVEPERSSVLMSIRAVGLNQTGRFADWSGDIRFDAAAPTSAQVTIEVQAASLRMRDPGLTALATGPGFLDVARYPVIGFRLTALRPTGPNRFEARAMVTVRGRAHEVVFPVGLRTDGDTARMTGGFWLDRAAYGIGLDGPLNAMLDRRVRVDVLLATRAG